MKRIYGNVVLVTGASSGIGKTIAYLLMTMGYRVYGTSRKKMDETVGDVNSEPVKSCGFIKMVQMDVCNEDSVKAAVNYILDREGTIDILINNAGFGIAGSVEDTTAEEALKQFDTNFFGVLRVCRNVIPVMRQNHRGLIINIGSVAGLISIPFQSMYSASKYALEAMSETLRIELKPFGINVTLIEPGDTKTGFTGSRQFTAAANENSVYTGRFKKSLSVMIKDEMNGPAPDTVAKIVAKVTEMKNPPVRIVAGFKYKVIVFLKRIIPACIVEYFITRIYDIPDHQHDDFSEGQLSELN